MEASHRSPDEIAARVDGAARSLRDAARLRDEPGGWERWQEAGRAWLTAVADAEAAVRTVERALGDGDPAAVDSALAYLERDPWYFRSGYAKQRLLARLRARDLDRAQRERVSALVLRAVDRGTFWTTREYAALARRFATNALRRALRDRLGSHDEGTAWRACTFLLAVKHPGLDAADRARVRDVLRRRAATGAFVSHHVLRHAERFWSPEWQEQLRRLARDERDLGARRLLDARHQQERVRAWKEAQRERRGRDPGAESSAAP
jgi:hypothetical protein